jgi:hypothetical protein
MIFNFIKDKKYFLNENGNYGDDDDDHHLLVYPRIGMPCALTYNDNIHINNENENDIIEWCRGEILNLNLNAGAGSIGVIFLHEEQDLP